jgi:plastocyanin
MVPAAGVAVPARAVSAVGRGGAPSREVDTKGVEMRWHLAAALAIALCLASSGAFAGDVMIHVGHNSLQPAEVSIEVGDTVTFHNMDEMPGGHTVTTDDESLSSPPLGKDQTWSHEFTEPGSFSFHIKEHADAKMTVVMK